MSINQLRGRSIRLDSNWKEKVANNWDIVCMAEEFTKGYDDYDRFKRKHLQLYGVCDDGTIEKGSVTYMQHSMMPNQRALTKEWRYSMKKC